MTSCSVSSASDAPRDLVGHVGLDPAQLTFCVHALLSEESEFLVRHWRSRILSEPRPGPEDGALGSVSLHGGRRSV